MRICWLYFKAMSNRARSVRTSLGVFLFRPISPTPTTLDRWKNCGIRAITSRPKATFSASLELNPIQQ